MKKLQKFISILSVCSCLFSCNKGDDNKQASPLADTVLTKERLIGKWDIKSVAQYFYFNDSVTYSYTLTDGVKSELMETLWGTGKVMIIPF